MPIAPFLAPERDSLAEIGRAKASGGTIYYTLPGNVMTSATGTTTPTFNEDRYGPFLVATPLVVDQLAAEVTTLASGKNFRMGIYRATSDWQPTGAPLADSGDISTTTTGVKTYTPATPIYLQRGRYVTVQNNDDSTVVVFFRTWNAQLGMSQPTALGANNIIRLTVARTYAAFPTPGTVWTTTASGSSVGIQHTVLMRVSTP